MADISVLIPVHNAPLTIESAIASILRQTFHDFEVVVVDDGSTDSTPEILDTLALADKRLHIIHLPHRGIIHALNCGISECRGDFIARMDGDDICHPRRLEMQVDFMKSHPEVSVCSSLIKMFPRSELPGGLICYEQWMNSLVTHEQIARDMFVESPVAHPSVMMRHSELIEIGGYQERGWAEDYDLWLRYHTSGKLFAKVPEVLTFWRQAAGRLTFTDSRYAVENFLRAKAYYLAAILKDCGRSIALWGTGKTGRRLIKHLIREGLPVESVIDIDRSKIGQTLRSLPIVGLEYLDTNPNTFVISAVSSHEARKLIREHMSSIGLVETRDFICAA
ncbi:MAG: glycosyltransferase [Armatimonadota bacterium]